MIQFYSRCGQTCGQAVFLTTSACGGSACIAGVSRDCGHGIFRLEGGATRTQIKRDTNFATPGYSLFCHDTTAEGKIKDFSVCGHSCGQSRFYAAFGNRGKSRKRRCRKALRRFALLCPGYGHGAPKSHAIPTGLHLNTITLYHGQIRKCKENLCARIGGTQILMTWVPRFWVTQGHSVWRWALLTGAGRVRGSLGYGLGSRIGCRCSRRCGGRRSFWIDPGCRSWGRPR